MRRIAVLNLFVVASGAFSATRVRICQNFFNSLSPVSGFAAPAECASLCETYARNSSCASTPNLATCVARNNFGCASLSSVHHVKTWTPEIVNADMDLIVCEGFYKALSPKNEMLPPESCAALCGIFRSDPVLCEGTPSLASCVSRKDFGCASLVSANKARASGRDHLSLSRAVESVRILSVCREHFENANLPMCAAHCLGTTCTGGTMHDCVAKQHPECSVETSRSADASRASSRITELLPEATFNALFPQLGAGRDRNCEGYLSFTYDGLVVSANKFPEFVNSGNDDNDKLELAAFLAQCSHETTGGTQGNPDAVTWGLCFREEVGCGPDKCPGYGVAESGASFHGRGGFQLSYEFNYQPFSQFYYGDDRLFKAPEKLLEDPAATWASAIWFWMTPQNPKISCHEAIKQTTIPNAEDVTRNRKPGFGWTTNIINGGIECGPSTSIQPQEQDRINFFVHYCNELGVCPGANLECWQQQQYGW